jgi:hypothetical protein
MNVRLPEKLSERTNPMLSTINHDSSASALHLRSVHSTREGKAVRQRMNKRALGTATYTVHASSEHSLYASRAHFALFWFVCVQAVISKCVLPQNLKLVLCCVNEHTR